MTWGFRRPERWQLGRQRRKQWPRELSGCPGAEQILWAPSEASAGWLGHLDTHCLCLGCLAAVYPSVPCRYVRPGPRYPPHRAAEAGRQAVTAWHPQLDPSCLHTERCPRPTRHPTVLGTLPGVLGGGRWRGCPPEACGGGGGTRRVVARWAFLVPARPRARGFHCIRGRHRPGQRVG